MDRRRSGEKRFRSLRIPVHSPVNQPCVRAWQDLEGSPCVVGAETARGYACGFEIGERCVGCDQERNVGGALCRTILKLYIIEFSGEPEAAAVCRLYETSISQHKRTLHDELSIAFDAECP